MRGNLSVLILLDAVFFTQIYATIKEMIYNYSTCIIEYNQLSKLNQSKAV